MARAPKTPASETKKQASRLPDYEKLQRLPLSSTVTQNYIAYAQGVLIDRAFPHIGDGQKPVQRRVAYTMQEEGITVHTKKSARIVGAVMGKYHPHGDASIYEALVNMVLPYKNNLPLVDGQGNFGSLDGSPYAAMRYTEARLSPIARQLLTEELRYKGIVPTAPNYDDTLQEPLYLPAKINFLLVNGSSGIGVVVRCNIPPYAVEDVLTATKYIVENKKWDRNKLLDEIIPAPSFPQPTVILKEDLPKIRELHETGTGSFSVYAPVTIHKTNKRKFLISGLTPQSNTEKLIAELGAHDAVSDVKDESTDQIRIVVTTTKPVEEVIDDLYRRTSLCKTFSTAYNIISEANEFVSSNLVDILERFARLRQQVIERRIQLQIKALDKEIAENGALAAVLGDIDRFLEIVKGSADPKAAAGAVAKFFKIDLSLAEYVIGLSIKTITKAERKKIEELLKRLQAEHKQLERDLKRIPQILGKEQDDVLALLKEKAPDTLTRQTRIQDKPYTYGTF